MATILAAALTYIWVWSFWIMVLGRAGCFDVVVSAGRLQLAWDDRTQWFWNCDCMWQPFRFDSSFGGFYQPTQSLVYFPIWVLALLATLCSAFFWHRYRRAIRAARIGVCLKCGYNRAGLDSAAPCPECGTAVAVAK